VRFAKEEREVAKEEREVAKEEREVAKEEREIALYERQLAMDTDHDRAEAWVQYEKWAESTIHCSG